MESDAFYVVCFIAAAVGFVVFGFVGVLIFERRKMNPTEGFLWGALLGPLGVIVALFIPPGEENQSGKKQ